jgi:cobalt/nickel transport system permease protein
MAVVLTMQAFMFADGGITALGANVLNMGVIGALLVGFLMLAAFRFVPRTPAVFLIVTGVASWLAVMVGAAATAVQLGLSDTVPMGTALAAMLSVHALIGIGEAAITVAAVSTVVAVRPDLIGLVDMREFGVETPVTLTPKEALR